MNPYKTKTLAFIDCETSGLNFAQHEIIEMGVVLYNREKQEVVKEWEVKIAPRHIETASEEALKINGYLNNPESYNANIKNALIKFNKLVENCILIGQNISFDYYFIKNYMNEFNIQPSFDRRIIDTMSLAWFYACEHDLNGLSLKDLCSHFHISNSGSHGALVDCRRALSLYRCLVEENNKHRK